MVENTTQLAWLGTVSQLGYDSVGFQTSKTLAVGLFNYFYHFLKFS